MPDSILASVEAAVEACKTQPQQKDIAKEEPVTEEEIQEDQKAYGTGKINASKTDTQKSLRQGERVVSAEKAKKIRALNKQVQEGTLSQQDAEDQARAILS